MPTSSDCPRFAVMLSIGPDIRERARLVDFLASVRRHEPTACAYAVVVNDGHDPAALREALEAQPLQTVFLDNPRAGRGWGWAGGLTTGLLTAMRWIAQHGPEVDFVLKADTDTFVVGPFAHKIHALFAADAQVGALGHYFNPSQAQTKPSGGMRERVRVWRARDWGRIRRLHAPFGLWRYPYWHVRSGLWGRAKRVRDLVDRALAQGYVFSEYCSGGGYALSRSVIERFEQQGLFKNVELFLDVPVTEDLIISMLVRGVGLKLAEGGRDIFGTHQSFFASAQALLDDQGMILHPVKYADPQQEEAVRAQLRRRASHPA